MSRTMLKYTSTSYRVVERLKEWSIEVKHRLKGIDTEEESLFTLSDRMKTKVFFEDSVTGDHVCFIMRLP